MIFSLGDELEENPQTGVKRSGMEREHMEYLAANNNEVELKRVQCQELEDVNISVGTYFTASIPSCSPKRQ